MDFIMTRKNYDLEFKVEVINDEWGHFPGISDSVNVNLEPFKPTSPKVEVLSTGTIYARSLNEQVGKVSIFQSYVSCITSREQYSLDRAQSLMDDWESLHIESAKFY
jgi:alpha-mannosidase